MFLTQAGCKLLKEIARVVKTDGLVITSQPFAWQEHEERFDFFRFSRFGITQLMEEAQLTIEGIERLNTAIDSMAITTNVYIIRHIVSNIKGAGLFINIFVCFPIQMTARMLSAILPDQRQLYLNTVVVARKAKKSLAGKT